jgi:hypothetical protein
MFALCLRVQISSKCLHPFRAPCPCVHLSPPAHELHAGLGLGKGMCLVERNGTGCLQMELRPVLPRKASGLFPARAGRCST